MNVLCCTSNKLLGFNQSILTQATAANGARRTLSNVVTAVSYQLDANGNLVSDGLRAFEYNAENRLNKVEITKDGEAAKITYLHNAAGQRVLKSEPLTAQTLPDEQVLGTTFTDWLKKNFAWMYANAQQNATLGTAYNYGDGNIPAWAILGEYGNGGANSSGRTEYIWLPTDDGNAIPIGMFRSNRFYAIHSDHLGTPRLMTDDQAKPVWQWAYSAFGENKPTGVLKVTTNPNTAFTNQPVLLNATNPTAVLNFRLPGQYWDSETGLAQNFMREYISSQGRYTQPDPIGLDGGWSRFGYVDGNPLSYTDPMGLQTSLQWCYQSPANAVACNEAGMTAKPILIPPPIVFPDDCNELCRKAVADASNAHWKLTTKRLPQYESGGTKGRDSNHAASIKQLQDALKKAISRVKTHCTVPPVQLPEWERVANQPLAE